MAVVCKMKKGDTIQIGKAAFKIIGLGTSSARVALIAPANDKIIFPPKSENDSRTIENCRTFAT